MARPDPVADRAASIADEQKDAYKRINDALKTLAERAGVPYEAVPTTARNAPDLLHLQQSHHLAQALEGLVQAGQPRTIEAAPDRPTTWNEGDVPSFPDSPSARPKKGG